MSKLYLDMKKTKPTEIDLVEIEAQELAEVLATETLAILRAYNKGKPLNLNAVVISMYLATLMGRLIENALSNEVITADTKRKRYNQASKSFSTLKSNIEFGISQGFQDGLSQFSGVPVGYQCIIKPVEEPRNTLPM